MTAELPLGGVRVAGASAGTCVRQLWIEDALGSSIIAIGFGAPICGVPVIIGIVMAGDMAPDCMPLGTPICEPGATGMPTCMGVDIDMLNGSPAPDAGRPSNWGKPVIEPFVGSPIID